MIDFITVMHSNNICCTFFGLFTLPLVHLDQVHQEYPWLPADQLYPALLSRQEYHVLPGENRNISLYDSSVLTP